MTTTTTTTATNATTTDKRRAMIMLVGRYRQLSKANFIFLVVVQALQLIEKKYVLFAL